MINFEELVQLVTQRVIEILEGEKSIPSPDYLTIVGKRDSQKEAQFTKEYGYELTVQFENTSGFLITTLTLPMLSRLASMQPQNEEETILVEGLMKGKAVYMLQEGRVYQGLLNGSVHAIKQKITYYENELERFGVKFVRLPLLEKRSRVISVKALETEEVRKTGEFIVKENTIITPLAKEYAEERNIKLIFERNEG